MAFSVGNALREGLARTFERSGLQLVAVFVAVRLASVVATSTLNRASLALAQQRGVVPGDGATGPLADLASAPTPFAVGLGLGGALLIFVAVALLAEALRIVAVRTVYADRTDAVPGGLARRNLGVASINGLVGVLVVITLTLVGLVLFVVPGVFLAVSFFFVRQEIAVRDANVVDAMAGSWKLVAGRRVAVLGLAVGLAVVGIGFYLIGATVSGISPAVGAAVNAVLQAFFAVFGVASVTTAYRGLREGNDEGTDPADVERYDAALTADDLPPPDETE